MKFPREMTRALKEFNYCSPSKIDDAVSILGELGHRVMILAGGTDLLNQMKRREVNPEFLLSLTNIKELEYIRNDKREGLKIGALTSITAIRESSMTKNGFASLYDAAEWFGTPQIRNMATVGGNVCRSSPSSDMVAAFMAFDAMLRLVGPKGVRTIPLEQFATGSGENVLDREILAEVVILQQEAPFGTAFTKLKRSSADLAKVSCAVRISMKDARCEDIRIVLGAVADRVIRAKAAEEIMRGEKMTDAVIEEAGRRASREAQPITDVRSTAGYRMQMVSVLTRRMIYSSLERLRRREN